MFIIRLKLKNRIIAADFADYADKNNYFRNSAGFAAYLFKETNVCICPVSLALIFIIAETREFMKHFKLVLIIFFVSTLASGQVVTNQKEAEKLYRQSIINGKISQEYFAEDKRCRQFIRERDYVKAEKSCRTAVLLVEKFPKNRIMERFSAYQSVGITLLRQQKPKDAIPFFEKSLVVAKLQLDDTDSETGEIYFLIGQAHHLLKDVEKARDYYTKAENAFRAAFKKIDDDEIRGYYPKVIKNILESHLVLLENEGLKEESAKMRLCLEDFRREFAAYFPMISPIA